MLQVNLTKRIQTPSGLRYCPAVESANGRIKPHVVSVDGKEEKHPEGAYYIEWREHGKRKRLSVGKDPAQAYAQKLRKRAEVNAKAQGVSVVSEDSGKAQEAGRSLQAAIAAYLEETRLSKKPKTLAAYTVALQYFAESCSKLYVEDIERADMLRFAAFLRDEKRQAPRSAYNKFENVMSFLKAQDIRGIVTKNDWPRYVEDEPEAYDKAELDTFLGACNPQERLWFDFFLMTGMREQEVIYSTWTDVDFVHGTVTVRWKPEFSWSPKAYKGREIPIPARLATALKGFAKARRERTCALLFPTSGCKPKNDFLDCCKAIAKRAGLNPADFWLHKFRATFATLSLQGGCDLRTVQNWLGHTDLESTLRYLKPARSQETRDKVEAIFG